MIVRTQTRISRPKVALVLFLALLASLLAGCQLELYSGLDEEEANKMLMILLAQDFDAAKVDKGKNGFALTVEKKQTVMALELLSANGHPRTKHESMGSVFSGQGMISTPVEEQSRLAYALSQELSETFSKIDGVLTARVHVVLTARDQSGNVSSPATAAVLIRHLPDSPVMNLTPKIKEISSKSVPGLSENSVSIMLIPVRIDMVFPTMPANSGLLGRPRLVLAIIVLLVGFALSLRHYLKRRKTSAIKAS